MDSQTLFLIVMVGFMGLLLWNSSRSRKKQAALLAAKLEIGAEVMLGSGIYGTIEAIADDRVILRSGTSTLEVARAAISRVTKAAQENKPAAKTAAKPAARKTTSAKPAARKSTTSTAAKKAK
jgi:preprotein translocase subunit YajC